jgi:hypothetical protein
MTPAQRDERRFWRLPLLPSVYKVSLTRAVHWVAEIIHDGPKVTIVYPTRAQAIRKALAALDRSKA